MQTANPRRWTALAVIALAQFMVIMDTSIIGVALPEIQTDLGFSPGDLSWVFNAYVVAFGGLLLLGGRLADLFGAKRLFLAGWAVLAVGSLAAGIAETTGVEIAARAAQGVGAAFIAPSALTLLMMLFGHDPKELMKAFAVYGAAAPAGGTAGVFLGGVIGAGAPTPRRVPDHRRRHRRGRSVRLERARGATRGPPHRPGDGTGARRPGRHPGQGANPAGRP
jgi:MFS family permease